MIEVLILILGALVAVVLMGTAMHAADCAAREADIRAEQREKERTR